MNILSSLLLCTAMNMDTLKYSSNQKNKNCNFTFFKCSILFPSIFTTFITFLSFCLGILINSYFTKNLSWIFGAVLLGFIGVYYLIEHIRIKMYKDGFDTSHYVENFKKYKEIIEDKDLCFHSFSLKNLINISIGLSINNIWPSIAGSLAGISISHLLVFNFIIYIFFYIIGSLFYYTKTIRFLSFNYCLITSILLLLISLLQFFY